MRRAEFVTAAILALLSVYIMWKSGEGPEWDTEYVHFSNVGVNIDGSGPGKGFWPFWLAAGMLVSCIWIIVNAILRKSLPSQSEEPFLDGFALKMLVLVGGGLIGFLILVDYISMYGAIAAFMFYYLFILGRHPVLFSAVLSLVVACWLYLFFDILMTLPQPKGVRAIDDNFYAPLGNFFRESGQWPLIGSLVIGIVALVLVARSSRIEKG